MNTQTVKKQAKRLQEYLKEVNNDITYSSCLHAVAKIHGYKNWNTLSASLENKHDVKTDPKSLFISQKFWPDLAPEVIAGAFYGLLQRVCNVESRPENFQIHQSEDKDQCITGFTIRNWENVEIKVNTDIENNSPDNKVNSFFQGIQLGEAIREIILGETSDKTMFRRARSTLDYGSIVKFAEQRNKEGSLPDKFIPSLELTAGIDIKKHPNLIELKKFISGQKAVADPRAYLIRVKEIVGSEYYVGFGGCHIHIKTRNQKKVIAFITNGI